MITQQNTSSVLASYATLKSLSDEKKYQSSYQILREFIRYIIILDSFYQFSAVQMKNRLADHFSFSIPEAVVKTSLKNMDGVELEHGTYTVTASELGSDSVFEDKKKEADDYESCIIHLLSAYIKERLGTSEIQESILTQELARFLTEDVSSAPMKYGNLIGEFVLKNEHDQNIQDGLNKIRQGSILYMGLCHSIGETGSLTKPLTLYLGTEILFSLAGYNGEIFQQFANDFMEQVRIANAGKSKKITLRYFSDIKKEIDEFFDTASEIVEHKRHRLLDKPAMKAIINGCSTSADIDVKKSDFYHLLQYQFGIAEDPRTDYYSEESFTSNLESFEYEDEADKNKKKETAIKFISHINKLRNGNRYHNDMEAEHLIVTNAKATLLISKEQVEQIKETESLDSLCNFAVSLDRITSLLWYKLGNGFSKKTFPTSVNAVLKARVVLSASIAKNAEKAFSEVKQQYEAGLLEESQLAARILTLRKKPAFPEDLQGDDIAEIMDFSPEYLSRYEEQFKQNAAALHEKEQVIRSLKEQTERTISEKDTALDLRNGIIKEKEQENLELRSRIEAYERKEAEAEKEKQKHENRRKFLFHLAAKSAGIISVTLLIFFCDQKLDLTIPPAFYAVVDTLALLTAFRAEIKEMKDRYWNS